MADGQKTTNWEPINFSLYLSFVKWWVLLAVAGEIALRLFVPQIIGGLFIPQVELVCWVWRFIILALVSWRLMKKYGRFPVIGALAGAMMGFILGVIISLFRFYDGFKVWKLFNILTETVLTTLVCCLFIYLVVFLFKHFKK